MQKMKSLSSFVLTIIILLFIFQRSYSVSRFQCLNKTGEAPALPDSFSTNIRINFMFEHYTVDMKYATNGKEGKGFIELKKAGRHVQYITRKDQNSTLFIEYKENESPTCEVTNTVLENDFLKKEDSGPNEILSHMINVTMSPDKFKLYAVEPFNETGVPTTRYEGCLSDPKIKISISFAEKVWKMSHISNQFQNTPLPEIVIAEIGEVFITALYFNFDQSVPDDSIFSPPPDVFCENFRPEKKPPKIPDYFSYNAEILVYESPTTPIVSQRKVYYDYPSGMSRIDFYDALAQTPDLFSKVTSQTKIIIHDFHAGVQYIFDPFTGGCTLDSFEATFNVLYAKQTKDNKMLKGEEFFWLNGANTSYNGQFPVRGMMADVYTALRIDSETGKQYIFSWYFSNEEAQVVGSEKVEKNVLLRMYVHPQTGHGKEGIVEINFYNFASQEPNVLTFDLTSCYNDSSSKIMVFTFPAVDSLKGSEKLIGMLIHLAIRETTGVRKHRINVREVIFREGYMYAEFSLLEDFYEKSNGMGDEPSLNVALKRLQDSVSNGKFEVKVPTTSETIILKPEPNGLNFFAGDRDTKPKEEGYKEGSVIGMTVGMLILGFLLGAVTLNLVMSRKFGVSLFQTANNGMRGFYR